MTDRQLLEAAAKAVNGGAWHPLTHDTPNGVWNPLLDDGDAFRLAVRLRFRIEPDYVEKCVFVNDVFEDWTDNELAATRRAIVRAAAAMGGAE